MAEAGVLRGDETQGGEFKLQLAASRRQPRRYARTVLHCLAPLAFRTWRQCQLLAIQHHSLDDHRRWRSVSGHALGAHHCQAGQRRHPGAAIPAAHRAQSETITALQIGQRFVPAVTNRKHLIRPSFGHAGQRRPHRRALAGPRPRRGLGRADLRAWRGRRGRVDSHPVSGTVWRPRQVSGGFLPRQRISRGRRPDDQTQRPARLAAPATGAVAGEPSNRRAAAP